MIRSTIASLATLLALFALVSCAEEKQEMATTPLVVMEDDRKLDPAYEPDFDPEAEAAANGVQKAWGIQVAETAQELHDLVAECHEKWIVTYEPDNILLGRPAVHAPDGVVTRMEKACDPIVMLLEDHYDGWVSKHPKTDAALRHWTLFADLYRRAYRYGSNVGTSAKRRKSNHVDMKRIKKDLIENNVPALLKSATLLSQWTDENTARWPAKAKQITPSEASVHWRKHIRNTVKEAEELKVQWTKRGHNLRKKGHFPRTRYLNHLGRIWEDRLARDRASLDGLTTGDATYDQQVRTQATRFYDALDDYFTNGWGVAMDAFAESNVIDEPKLKAGKDAFKKKWKALTKAGKKVKIPNAG